MPQAVRPSPSPLHRTGARPASRGKPIDPGVRPQLEAGFGRSLAGVRVHDDDAAHQAAQALGAHAYTTGEDIVFARGQYAPQSREGQRLLAHELTHVVQQSGGAAPVPRLQRKCACGGSCPRCEDEAAKRRVQTKTAIGTAGDAYEQEADRVADRIVSGGAAPPISAGPPMIQRDEDTELRFFDDPFSVNIPEHIVIPLGAPPDIHLELPPFLSERPSGLSLGSPSLELAPLPQPAMVVRVSRCFPDRALTWGDFQGTPSGTFSAETAASITKQSVGGQNMYRAMLDPAASWVRPEFANPTDRTVNNCGSFVSDCEDFFNGLGPGETGTMPFEIPASRRCPASATLARVTATSAGECESVIGSNCDATRVTESNRLLAHEQGHFDITCAFAHKANDALLSGSTEAQIDRRLTTQLNAAQSAYDTQTNHGCNAAAQARWEADIASGLPSRTIP